MSEKNEQDPNEFWWKIGSVAIAVMVWFIITTVADLSYTNRDRDIRQPVPKQPGTNSLATPPLANPDLKGDNNEPDDETDE